MGRIAYRVAIIAILATCIQPAFSQMASQPLSPGDRGLVRRCIAMYGRWAVPAGEEQTTKSAQQAAKRFFNAMPQEEIERRLVPIRKALYRGTRAYTSVAYVLAYYRIDFERNGRRVVEAIRLGIEPPAKLKAAGFKGQEGNDAGQEEVADAVETLYRRRHSAELLKAYLRAPVDGHLGEDWTVTIGQLFLAYPTDVLRAASEPRDMKILAECVYIGIGELPDTKKSPDRKVWQTIHTLERSRNPETARLARRFHQAYVSERRKG